MSTLSRLNETNDIKKFVDNLLEEKNVKKGSNEIILQLENFYKGFIPLNSLVSYGTVGSCMYSLNDRTYLYDAFDYIKKLGTALEYAVIMELKTFLTTYFGISPKGIDNRDNFIIQKFLEKNNVMSFNENPNMVTLADFKKRNMAKCSENSILINQVLNLLDIETYICYGFIKKANEIEPHAFNIIKYNDKYYLLDYSIYVLGLVKRQKNEGGFSECSGNYDEHLKSTSENNIKMIIPYPFQAEISFDKLYLFLNNSIEITFENYNIELNMDGSIVKKELGTNRSYIIADKVKEKSK